jgi:polyisoprenoid-binding protein YceI
MKSFASLALAAFTFVTPVLATTYTLEPNYTQVVLSWDHLGYSFPTAQIAQGQGMLEFDAMDPTQASLKVTLPLASLISGVPDLDEHLKSKDFFDVARFPVATFTSTKVEMGRSADRLKVTGDLTIRDVTRAVVLDVRVLKAGSNPRTQIATIGFNATGMLKRSDFGLGAYVPQVGDEIALQVTCQGAESRAYAAYLKRRDEERKATKQ